MEKLTQRAITMDLHEVTLAEYYKMQMIPRGLRVRLIPTLFSQNMDFKTKFAQILNKCSFDIMTLTVQFLQQERTLVQQEIVQLEEQLQQCSNQEELMEFKKTNKDKLEKFRTNVQLRKRTKLERDREDYKSDRIYNWTDPIYHHPK